MLPHSQPTRRFISAFILHTTVFFSLQSLCLMHTGKPTGVAVSHCITWFQTQVILAACHCSVHSIVIGGVPCAVRALCEK